MDDINEIDLAYIAGLYDCTGTIYMNQGTKLAPYIHAQMQTQEVESLCKVKEVFGGSVNTRSNGISYWLCFGKRAANTLETIQPYSKIKRRKDLINLTLKYPFLEKGKRLPTDESKKRHKKILALEKQMQKRNAVRDNRVVFNKRKGKKPSELDFAYLGGVLDGKGIILAADPKWRSAVLRVYTTDPELARYLWDHFEGSVSKVQPRGTAIRTSYIWNCQITQSRRLMDRVLPYMQSTRKKELYEHWRTNQMPARVRPKDQSKELLPSKWAAMFQ
jgi:hypothetical protein